MTDRLHALNGIKGWLLIYVVGLFLFTIHALILTVGSIVVYINPSLAGLSFFVPLWALIFYVATNGAEIVYAIILFFLMFRKRKLAIINNLVFNVLTVAFLIAWHLLSEKSNFGTIVDSLPGIVGFFYILFSKRVKATFTEA